MAYIEPNSVVKVCYGVPFEPDYEHTVLFPSEGAQSFSIGSSAKYTYTPTTYQRVNKNRIRVATKADNLYECNYLMFQNTNYGTKWFYAFITAIEYINNECTEISYEIDVWQTYLFDFRIGDCFVEREHIASDSLGANYIPESLNVGDLVIHSNIYRDAVTNNLGIYILVASSSVQASTPGHLIDQTFQGGMLYCFHIDQTNLNQTQSTIRTFLANFDNNPEDILGIWTAPYNADDVQGLVVRGHGGIHYNWLTSIPALTGRETFGSYTPKNRKLYTYPYTCFIVNNTLGDRRVYRYEFFENFQPNFEIYVNETFPAQATLTPLNYKGGNLKPCMMNESISVTGWGAGSFTADTWQRMLNVSAIDAGLGIPKGLFGYAAGGHASRAINGVGGVFNVLNVIAKEDYIANTQYGEASSNAMSASNEIGFYAARYGVCEQFARMIDDYFSMYGYQTNEIKEPNITSRPHWNYLKARNCTILGGSMPATAEKTIKETLEKGITFWHSYSEVGMYGYDNSSP